MTNRIRIWPLLVLLALDLGLVVFVRSNADLSGQERVTLTMAIQVITFVLALFWLVLFSRLPWRNRLLTFAGTIVVIALFFALFRIREFSGDLLPIFEFRWQERALSAQMKETDEIVDIAQPTSIDFPQFLGPDRDAILDGPMLSRDWQVNPPQEIWRTQIGAGWSGFAIVGNLAVTQEQRGKKELVTCYDLRDGQLIWKHEDTTRFYTVLAGEGPRATPTINERRVFSLGATGILNCLNLLTGEPVWRTNIFKDSGSATPEYGASGSPLVLDTLVVVCAGGTDGRSLVAYRKSTGERTWAAGNDRAAYSSPFLTDIAGTSQIIIFNLAAVVGHDPINGDILWRYPYDHQTQNVAQPLVFNQGRLLISTGYGVGSTLLRIEYDDSKSAFEYSEIWHSNRMKAKFTNLVHRDGYIYGLDDGILACMALQDGKRQWKRGRYGHGQVLLVGDLMLVVSEDGELALVEANPEAFVEHGIVPVLNDKTWNNPALAGSTLLMRNHKTAVCLELPLAAEGI